MTTNMVVPSQLSVGINTVLDSLELLYPPSPKRSSLSVPAGKRSARRSRLNTPDFCPCGLPMVDGECPNCDVDDAIPQRRATMPSAATQSTTEKPRLDFMEQSRALAKEEKIPLHTAMSNLAKENPDLHEQFVENAAGQVALQNIERRLKCEAEAKRRFPKYKAGH